MCKFLQHRKLNCGHVDPFRIFLGVLYLEGRMGKNNTCIDRPINVEIV